MWRSILAVIAGSLTWMVTALGTDAIINSFFPELFNNGGLVRSVPVLLFAGSYSLLFSVLGGYVTALIARRQEMLHAFILGILQLLMGIAATLQFWNTAPAWYHLTFLTLLVPANLVGGLWRLRQKQRAHRPRLRAA